MNYITSEQYEVLAKSLKNLSNEIEVSEYGVRKVKNYDVCLSLDFGNNEAISRVLIDIDERTGQYYVTLGSWSAVTFEAKKSIESKRFDDAKRAIDYAVHTSITINNFFKLF